MDGTDNIRRKRFVDRCRKAGNSSGTLCRPVKRKSKD
jgi:hypothetical protein